MSQDVPTRVLVVDDDPTIAKLLTLVLTQAGYQVTVAETGEKGLSLAGRILPDIAILDVMLPGMSGYDVARRMRASPTTNFIPILILTAQAETRDKLAGFNAGADDYLTKPFDPSELVFRVKALLARSHAPPPPPPSSVKRGKLITVFGAKGGVGKTTIAVNLAIALARMANTRVALVDADFSFGDVGAHLNLAPSRSILDVVSRVEDMDLELVRKVMLTHESGVRVLLGPYHPQDAERIPSEALRRIMLALTEHFDFVIVDCASSYDERTLVLLEAADQIIMVLTPEIGPVKNTSTFLEMADKLDISASKIHIVLNRANSEVGIAAPEIARALQKPIPLRLNSGGRPVVLSVNRGLPLLMEQPQHPFSQQITRLAEILRAPVPVSPR